MSIDNVCAFIVIYLPFVISHTRQKNLQSIQAPQVLLLFINSNSYLNCGP